MIANACQCEACRSACEQKPGWFKPEDIAPLAAALGLTEQELFDQHLMADFWVGDDLTDDQDVFVLSPATKDGVVGEIAPFRPRGVCRWLKDGKCAIHEQGKPFECRAYHHTDDPEDHSHHQEAALAWNKPEHQAKIRRLLGREPEITPPTILDMLQMKFPDMFEEMET